MQGTRFRIRTAGRALVLAVAATALLAAGGAAAETYEILIGEAHSAASGVEQALSGSFEAELAPFDLGPGQRALLVDDFAIRVGEREFSPASPILFEGLEPVLYLRAADGIVLAGDAVEVFLMRAGGEVIAADGDTVTFRFFDFRSWSIADPDAPVDAGDTAGELGDDAVPRRLRLSGSLFATDETFAIRREPCPPPPVLDPPGGGGGGGGGGVVIGGGGGVITTFESFDLDPDETVAFVSPGGSDGALARVTGGGGSGIEGGLGGELVSPVGPPVFDTCPGLLRSGLPEETALGTFEWVATAARPMAIAVVPRRRGGALDPGGRAPVSVVVRGDEELDVREIDPASLRLGPDSAKPRGRPRFVDLPRDGFPDLVARFRTRDAGIAYGDRFVCLLGETVRGELLEGCDAIDTLPAAAPRVRRGRD